MKCSSTTRYALAQETISSSDVVRSVFASAHVALPAACALLFAAAGDVLDGSASISMMCMMSLAMSAFVTMAVIRGQHGTGKWR